MLGLRRLSLVALAGPFGVTAIVLAAELGRLIGLRWGWPQLLAVTVLVAAGLWLLRRGLGHRLHRDPEKPNIPAPWRSVALAWAVSAVPWPPR